MPRHAKKTRARGGASCPCPRCKGDTRVLVTRRMDLLVQRQRECLGCERRFVTYEKVSKK